jgi:predicted  nucleic acid-binding Zn-ribbon protein
VLKERGKEALYQADHANKKRIEAQLGEINSEWRNLVSGLEGRRDTLDLLSSHWEDLESKWSSTEAKLNAIEERGKLVDTVVRSKQHILDTAKTINVSNTLCSAK